ncbi:MAG: conjugative relaxase [Gammaproteobacteria bacterium]|nr:conjugative relaxase [Gammaproteobacteria bacterium]
MLSISNVGSASAAGSYFEVDDYYTKENAEEHQALSEWYGKGAEALGLSGSVQGTDFKAILEGSLPSGQKLGRMEKGKLIHAPGIDLTFSAPKSVSILAEVGGDKRIYAAHTQAVKATVDWIEKNAIGTRAYEAGRVVEKPVDNLVAALFRHDTSRNLDPQLHTHAVIANMTQRGDGEWRSLAAGQIFDNKMLGGLMYRAELAASLKEMGYHIEKTSSDGRFEVTDVPKELLDAFSTRSKDIRAEMERRGLDQAKDAEQVALRTRERKEHGTDREALREVWREVTAERGIDLSDIIEAAKERERPPSINSSQTSEITNSDPRHEGKEAGRGALAAVRYATAHLSERSAAFSFQEVQKVALAYALGNVRPSEVVAAMKEALADGFLLESPSNSTLVTTRESINLERETVDLMAGGKGIMPSIAVAGRVDSALSESTLNEGQSNAARAILTGNDRFVGIQGYAGTGKTYMLAKVNEIAKKNGYTLRGLAPTGSAANTLGAEGGFESATLQSFLAQYAGVAAERLTEEGRTALQQDYSKTVLVLDETSFASTQQMRDFMKIIEEVDARAVLVGDVKQLGAVEAGKPFDQLQKAGMSTTVMDDILRQKDENLKEAVYSSIAGNILTAFKKLGENVHQVNQSQLGDSVAEHWLSLTAEQRENTLLLAPSNNLRKEINRHIREGLVREGLLNGYEKSTHVYVNAGLTKVERSHATNYAEGNVVKFHQNLKSLGVEKGEYLTVKAVDAESNTVSLEKAGSEVIDWNPSRVGVSSSEVYRTEERVLQSGDEIRWTEGDRQKGVVNSDTAKVLGADEKGFSVEYADGKKEYLSWEEQRNHHWDYAYSSTVHAAQGKTVDNVIGAIESYHEKLTSQQSFYVSISRARQEASLYTDDTSKAISTIGGNLGEKLAAVESLGLDYEKLLDQHQRAGLSFTEAIDKILDDAKAPEYDRDKEEKWSYWEQSVLGVGVEQEETGGPDSKKAEKDAEEFSWDNYFAFEHSVDPEQEHEVGGEHEI